MIPHKREKGWCMRTYLVMAYGIETVQSRLDAINRKAEKLGFPKWEVKFGPPFWKELWTPVVKDGCRYESLLDHLVCEATISGEESISIQGWTLVANVEVLESGNLIANFSGEQLPEQFRTRTVCDHCRIRRFRHDYFILRNQQGEFKQVGSSCLQDFVGHSADDLLARASMVKEMSDAMSEASEPGSGGGRDAGGDLEGFLLITIATIEAFGWTSRKVSEETGRVSTLSKIFDYMSSCRNGVKRYVYTDSQKSECDKIVAWAKSLDDKSNEYLWNLKIIADSNRVSTRTQGLACSMVEAYRRAHHVVSETVSQFVGTVGERSLFSLRFNKALAFQSQFGTTFFCLFTDKQGNVFKWKASSRPQDSTGKFLVEGSEYNVFGTIVEHSEYKGVNQTCLSRCKLLSDDEALAQSKKGARKQTKAMK